MRILIAVDVTDDANPKLTLTCENCGGEIEDTGEGPPIINIKGSIAPERFEAFKRAYYDAVNRGEHRAMITNAEDVEIVQCDPSLHAVVIAHAKRCKKRST